jgi:hypothetical protein
MTAMPRYHDFLLRDPFPSVAKSAPEPARRGLLRRAVEAIRLWRQRQEEREIARFLGGRGGEYGGHLTDESERELFEHLTHNSSFRP